MMTKEEYRKRSQEDEEWAPGWDAIEQSFEKAYPGMNPVHFGTELHSRAIFGGDNYLDGYSIYTSSKGYQHIVTFGMSELYANPEQYGEEYSGWGYEMTIKLKEDSPESCIWAIDILSNLARYTYQSKRFFQAGECIPGNGTTLHIGTDSMITGLLVVNDTIIPTVNSVNGKVEFLQLVGITETECNAIKEDIDKIPILIDRMKQDNPELITDMKRTISYL